MSIKSAYLNIWLAFVSYPVTTAVYFERALRRQYRTTTIGPRLPHELIEKWQLQNMKLPINDQDIPTGANPDMAQILAETASDNHPDLYLWIESVGGHYPQNLESQPCPKACYLIDSHLNLPAHLEWARKFDMVFIAQREYLDEFRKLGMRVYWLPLGCDPDVHFRAELPKSHTIGFVGGVQPASRREDLLKKISCQIPVHYERCFWDDMARIFSQSQIVFNEAVKNDLNMRIFEAMSCGTLLLTDMAHNSGQEILFRNGEDYAVYNDQNILDVARFYLENNELREQIAKRGQRLVHTAHTYAHRVDDLIAVALNGKPDTFSAVELRQRSLSDIPPIDAAVSAGCFISTAQRSFIIPVLDMSPASEYNIVTLLADLENIEGDVIVIFNGPEVAEQLKGHPRITQYAIMKQNIGVARAWNLGLEIAATPIAFILNADLHVKATAIDALENALTTLPDAACVGTQGSFTEYTLARDYVYFDKGSFDHPIAVDAVSGFFFAIKLVLFKNKTIRFENSYTPCYFEEWDLGLQIKRAGLKSYIIPTSDYDHHWSGTIRALREISYYDRSETGDQKPLRNRRIFHNKWRGIAASDNDDTLFESGFMDYIADQTEILIANEKFNEAEILLNNATNRARENQRIAVQQRFISILKDKNGGTGS